MFCLESLNYGKLTNIFVKSTISWKICGYQNGKNFEWCIVCFHNLSEICPLIIKTDRLKLNGQRNVLKHIDSCMSWFQKCDFQNLRFSSIVSITLGAQPIQPLLPWFGKKWLCCLGCWIRGVKSMIFKLKEVEFLVWGRLKDQKGIL